MTVVAAPGLEQRLKREISGDVWFDRFTRGRYATDASHYQMMPLGVAAPRSVAEVERAIALARTEGVTVLARGGGTWNAAQMAVANGTTVDAKLQAGWPVKVPVSQRYDSSRG